MQLANDPHDLVGQHGRLLLAVELGQQVDDFVAEGFQVLFNSIIHNLLPQPVIEMEHNEYGSSPYIPDKFREEFGFELPDWFWNSMGKKVRFYNTIETSSYFDPETNEVIIAKRWSGFDRTPLMSRSTVVHEYGHAYHYNTGLINEFKVAEPVLAFFHSSAVAARNLKADQQPLLRTDLHDINLRLLRMTYPQLQEPEAIRLFIVTGSFFQAASNGAMGFGHHPLYYQHEMNKFMELFAVSADIYFNGNPVFEDLFPFEYQMIVKFWNDEKRRSTSPVSPV